MRKISAFVRDNTVGLSKSLTNDEDGDDCCSDAQSNCLLGTLDLYWRPRR
jgi:hypothetical protein